ncbi:hypothetical protein [Xanthomonas sacchari]|uniref:hypothetical protein n=1 Tax=Xanthomonas sacchari TaxID=56458 RepID=UPI00225E6F31|nr:hypothetical protein [Xanthomonas sacchari]MCW0435288.1 hypothetical protein [Xanthomonas sacchari]
MVDAADLIIKAIEEEKYVLRGYEKPSEAITMEVLRAIDHAYCRDLFPWSEELEKSERMALELRKWAINGALKRVMPLDLRISKNNIFTSSAGTAEQTDEFLFRVGCLALAEQQLPLLRSGALEGRIDGRIAGGMKLLVLTVRDDATYSEQIGRQGLHWLSDMTMAGDRPREASLERRHMEVLPHLTRYLRNPSSHKLPFDGVDDYFAEWAVLYLRRMSYRDLLGEDDNFGGRPVADYLGVLAALSAMSQQRLCYAGLLNDDHPGVGIRNLMTGCAPHVELIEGVASFLDAGYGEVAEILDHFVLEPGNAGVHLESGTPAFAPVVRTSREFSMLPMYGLELNPFLFLWTELRRRYEKEWFEAANRREARWIAEMEQIFVASGWSCLGGVKIKDGGRILTDIDFVACDEKSGGIILFQLKWQQPFTIDHKIRRNNASNLIEEGNRWIAGVIEWMEAGGVETLKARFSLKDNAKNLVHLIVLGRYHAHFTGAAKCDSRAIWCDWGNFVRQVAENGGVGCGDFIDRLRAIIVDHRSALEKESFFIPLADRLAILVNPGKTVTN